MLATSSNLGAHLSALWLHCSTLSRLPTLPQFVRPDCDWCWSMTGRKCVCVYLHAHTCVLYNLDDSIWKLDRRYGSEELLHLFAFLKIEQQITCRPECSPLQIDWCNTTALNMFIFIQIHSVCIKYTLPQFNFHSNIIVSVENTQTEQPCYMFTIIVYRWLCWNAECCTPIYFIKASTSKCSFIQK